MQNWVSVLVEACGATIVPAVSDEPNREPGFVGADGQEEPVFPYETEKKAKDQGQSIFG
jgi:hypothetical protein